MRTRALFAAGAHYGDRGGMMAEPANNQKQDIPCQVSVPWKVVFSVSWGNLRRRFFRSLITMLGVILAIAFLTYMLV